MNQIQTFILAIVLLIAAVVLYVAGYDVPGSLALGAVIGVLAPSGIAPKGA